MDPKLCYCNQDIWSKILFLVEYIMCQRHMFLEHMLYNITIRESFYSTVTYFKLFLQDIG